MKTGTICVALIAGLLMLAQTELASTAESSKVGVIQQRVVLEKTKAGKRALEALKDFQASRRLIAEADDQELKKLENELKAQESTLSESQKRNKQEQFSTKFENYQKRLQDFEREIQQKQKELSDDFQKKMDEAVQVVAEKGGFAAVIDEGGAPMIQIVLYAHPSVNLTAQVIKEFDRRNK